MQSPANHFQTLHKAIAAVFTQRRIQSPVCDSHLYWTSICHAPQAVARPAAFHASRVARSDAAVQITITLRDVILPDQLERPDVLLGKAAP